MDKPVKIKWLDAPEDHDYPAAQSYLSLLFEAAAVARYLQQLKGVAVISFKAKDIFRASHLPLLGASNFHVEKDRSRISSGHALSPLLLVRDPSNHRTIIADGYHRLCAVYSYDEDALIPCKIV